MIFIHFNDWGKSIKGMVFWNMWQLLDTEISVSANEILLSCSRTCLLTHLGGCFLTARVQWLQQKPHGPQDLTHELSGLLWEKTFIVIWKLRAAIIHVFSRQQLETLLDIYWLYLLHQLCSTHTAFQQLLADYCSLEIIAFTGKEIPTYLVSICYFHNNVFWPVLKDLKGSFLRWLLDVFTEQKFLGHILLCRLYSRLFIS